MNSLFTVLNEQKLIHETFNFTHTTSSIIDAILDILTVQLLKIPDFTDVKPCHWDSLKHCRALLFRGWEVLGLKTSETTHPMLMHHIPENLTLQHYLYCGNFFKAFFIHLRKSTISFVMSVHLSACNNLAPTGWSSWDLIFDYFSKKLSRKFKFH